VIALDSNVLVHAHRHDSPFRDRAAQCIQSLAESPAAWAIPCPCVHEFLSIVTHPRIYDPASTIGEAVAQVDAWLESPALVVPSEASGHWKLMRNLMTKGRVAGPKVHDGRIAAICLEHGVRELWSADRNFSRFPALTTRNPLVG
jgi:toxin-antitoxin system PIN domain toxin